MPEAVSIKLIEVEEQDQDIVAQKKSGKERKGSLSKELKQKIRRFGSNDRKIS